MITNNTPRDQRICLTIFDCDSLVVTIRLVVITANCKLSGAYLAEYTNVDIWKRYFS